MAKRCESRWARDREIQRGSMAAAWLLGRLRGIAGVVSAVVLTSVGAPCVRGDETLPQSVTVNPSSGGYEERVDDLRVKVPGDRASVVRYFSRTSWDFGFLSLPRQIEVVDILRSLSSSAPSNSATVKVLIAGVMHEGAGVIDGQGGVVGGVFYSSSGDRLERTASGWTWQPTTGDTLHYGSVGELLDFTDRHGARIAYGYDATTNQIVAVYDHYTNRVLWIDYKTNLLISAVRDAAAGGREVRYAYDASGRLTNVVDVLGGATAYRYDGQNRLIYERVPSGREVFIGYHSDGTIASVADAEGRGDYFEFSYDEASDEYYSYHRDAAGVIHEEALDSGFRQIRKLVNGKALPVSSAISPPPDAPTVDYDGQGSIVAVHHANGRTERFTYAGPYARLTREISSYGLTNLYEYDGRWNLTNIVRAAGSAQQRSVAATYDAMGNLVGIRSSADASMPATELAMEYDAAGNIHRFALNDGTEAVCSYDRMGNLTRIEDSRGGATVIDRDALGRPVRDEDPSGEATYYAYGSSTTVISNNSGAAIRYTFDREDHLLSISDERGTLETFGSDALGRITEVRDEGGALRAAYAYDEMGRLASAQNGLGQTTAFEYDPDQPHSDIPKTIRYQTYSLVSEADDLGRLTTLNAVVGTNTAFSMHYAYDELGRVISETSESGLVTAYRYSPAGRLVAWSNATSGEMAFDWNDANLLRSVRDGLGRQMQLQYDAAGRLTNVADNGGLVMAMSYQQNQAPDHITYASGRRQSLFYDAAGQVTQVVYEAAPPAPSKRVGTTPHLMDYGNPIAVEIGFDANHNVSVEKSPEATVRYFYNDLQQVEREETDYGSFTLTTSYAYDSQGNMVSMTMPNGEVMAIRRDDYGRPTSVDLSGNRSIAVSDYDAWNAPRQIVYPGNMVTQVGVDDLGRQTSLVTKDPAGNVLFGETYQYAASGQLVAKTGGAVQEQYSYDAAGRLTGVSSSAGQNESYTYDALSGRTSMQGVSGSFTYDDAHRLQSYGDVVMTYDKDGNVTRKEQPGGRTLAFTYDAAQRLISVDDGSGNVIASYGYDGANRRIWKEVDGERTYFHYVGGKLAGEYDANGQAIRTYGQFPGSLGYPLYVKEGDAYYWTVTDQRSAVTRLVDENGRVAWSGDYGAFGLRDETTADVRNNFRFPGQYYDEETGLYFNGERYYDPDVGRYISPGTRLSVQGEDPYVYADASPFYVAQPNGMASKVARKLGLIEKPLLFLQAFTTKPACAAASIAMRRVVGPVLAPLVTALSGDRLKNSDIETELPKDQCSYLLSMNGIANNPEQSRALEQNFYELFKGITGVEPTRFPNVAEVNTTHGLAAMRDILQCALTHFGLTDVGSIWLAAQMKAIVNHCKKAGRGPDSCCIYLFAHSQGTMISDRALGQLLPNERRYVRYIGVEGQQMVARDHASAVWNFANRATSPWDIVSGGSDPVADFDWTLPGANWIEYACGFRRNVDVVEMKSNKRYFENHNPKLYSGIMASTLATDKRFRCKCAK